MLASLPPHARKISRPLLPTRAGAAPPLRAPRASGEGRLRNMSSQDESETCAKDDAGAGAGAADHSNLQENTKPSNKTSSTSIECSIFSNIITGHSKTSLGMRQVEEHACPGLTAYVSIRQHTSAYKSAYVSMCQVQDYACPCLTTRIRVHALLRASYPSASCLLSALF
jgi:hypothetical protein